MRVLFTSAYILLVVQMASFAQITTPEPVIDMHFHTIWDGPEMKEPLTSFLSPKTPDELRRLNMAALNRYHIVKALASGDQLKLYEQELGPRLLPGILLPESLSTLGSKGDLPVSPAALRQMHQEGKLTALADNAERGVMRSHPAGGAAWWAGDGPLALH